MIDFNISALEEKVDELDIKLKSKQEQLHTLLNYKVSLTISQTF